MLKVKARKSHEVRKSRKSHEVRKSRKSVRKSRKRVRKSHEARKSVRKSHEVRGPTRKSLKSLKSRKSRKSHGVSLKSYTDGVKTRGPRSRDSLRTRRTPKSARRSMRGGVGEKVCVEELQEIINLIRTSLGNTTREALTKTCTQIGLKKSPEMLRRAGRKRECVRTCCIAELPTIVIDCSFD